MRSIARYGLVVVLLPACTRLNPAFDGGEGESDGPGDGEPTAGMGTTAAGASTGKDEGAETRASTAADSTRGTSESDTSTESGSGLEGMLETGHTCTLEFAEDYTLTTIPPLMEVLGGCPPGANVLHIQVLDVNGNTVMGNNCAPGCACGEDMITLTFGGDLLLPPLPGCFDLAFRVDPSCAVQEYEIRSDIDPGLPVFMASNETKAIGPLAFYTSPVGPDEPCGEGCMFPPQPGHYTLYQNNTNFPVPPSGSPTLLMGPPADYLVVNDRSGVGDDCLEVVHWYATREP